MFLRLRESRDVLALPSDVGLPWAGAVDHSQEIPVLLLLLKKQDINNVWGKKFLKYLPNRWRKMSANSSVWRCWLPPLFPRNAAAAYRRDNKEKRISIQVEIHFKYSYFYLFVEAECLPIPDRCCRVSLCAFDSTHALGNSTRRKDILR